MHLCLAGGAILLGGVYYWMTQRHGENEPQSKLLQNPDAFMPVCMIVSSTLFWTRARAELVSGALHAWSGCALTFAGVAHDAKEKAKQEAERIQQSIEEKARNSRK